MKSFYLSNEFVDPFVNGLKLSSQVSKLNVSRTHLTEENAVKVVQNIPQNLSDLDASHNPKLGVKSI